MPKSYPAEGLRKPGSATTPLVHLQVPPGMDAALRGLTREVLRRQPSDLYLFAHRYFESLLADRVAQQGGDEVTDAESLFSKKQSMRDLFQEDVSKRSREIVHRIHLEDDASPDKNVVHNINIEVEGEDASNEETTVKVEISGDEGKKKRRESRDATSFEEEITTTRTEHMTVCKSWKVETRVETSESGEIRVESFTNAGKTKQSSKPRKFASEEGKKSKSLIEEEKRAAKAQREKTKRESSTSFESVDKSASIELIMLERQADAQKSKTDEAKKYKSFVRLDDDPAADESERLIEIERKEALTRSRRDVGDSTHEVPPDGLVLPQSSQVALQKMEESLIQLKKLDAKAEPLKREGAESKVFSEVANETLRGLTSPGDALVKMEKSLIELKETTSTGTTETRKGEISTDKGSLDDKQSISIKSEGESKSLDVLEEKHKIIESVKEVVHEIEEKASGVSSHINESQTTEEKQCAKESKSSEEKHKILDNVKEVVHKIEEKATSVLSHIHGSQSPEEKQSIKLEEDSMSEKRHKIMNDVKEVVHEIEANTSNVRTHFPEKTQTSIETTKVIDQLPDGKESLITEAQKETERGSKLEIAETSAEMTEDQDANANDKPSIAVHAKVEERRRKAEKVIDEKTEDLDPSADAKESIVAEVEREIERSDPGQIERLNEKAKEAELNLEGIVVEAEARKQSSKHEKTESDETTEVSDLKDSAVLEARMLTEDVAKDTEEKFEKTDSSAEEREGVDYTGEESIAVEARRREQSPEPEKTKFTEKTDVPRQRSEDSTGTVSEECEKAGVTSQDAKEKPEEMKSFVENTRALDHKGKESIVEESQTKRGDTAMDAVRKLDNTISSDTNTEILDLKGKEGIVDKTRIKVDDDALEDAEEKFKKMELSAEKTEILDLKGKESTVDETREKGDGTLEETKETLEKIESSAEKTEALDLKGKDSTVDEAREKRDDTLEDKEQLANTESFAEKNEALDLKGEEGDMGEAGEKRDDTLEDTKEKLEKIEPSSAKSEALDLKGKYSTGDETREKGDGTLEETKEKLEKMESFAEKSKALDLKGEKGDMGEAREKGDDTLEDTKEKTEKIESSAEKTGAFDLKGKDDVEGEARKKGDDTLENTQVKLEKMESSAEKTEGLDLKGKEAVVGEAGEKGDDTLEDAKEKLEMGSCAGKTEVLGLYMESKESIELKTCMKKDTVEDGEKGRLEDTEESRIKADDEVDDAEEKLGKIEPTEKTTDFDLEGSESIVVETGMNKDEAEDIEKGRLEHQFKTPEGIDRKKGREEDIESKGQQKREVKEAMTVEKADDKAACEEKPDSIHGGFQESTQEGVAQSSTEKKPTSSKPPTEDEDKKAVQREQTDVEGDGKETEGRESSTAESTEKGEHRITAEITIQETSDHESQGGQPHKRIPDGSSEEESGEEELSKKEDVLLPEESEQQEADIETERRSEGVKVEDTEEITIGDAKPSDAKDTQGNLASAAENHRKSSDQLEIKVASNIDESKSADDRKTSERVAAKSTAVKDAAVDGSESLSEKKGAASKSESRGITIEREAHSEKKPGAMVGEKEVEAEKELGESPSDKDLSQVMRIRRSTEETFTKTEKVSKSTSTSIMTQTILLGGPENEVKSMQTEVREHQEEKLQTETHVIKKDVDIDDVFGHKMYPPEEVNDLLETIKRQDVPRDGIAAEIRAKIDDSADQTSESVAASSGELKAQDSVESSDGVENSSAKSIEGDGSVREESSDEKPHQRKLASLDEESTSVSEGTGDRFLPPTVVISRVTDVAELTDGEAKIVSQMEKEGLTTEYDENIKVRTGHWSAEDANKFLAGESQHTYYTLKKPELVYSELNESRPPEKSVLKASDSPALEEPEKSKVIEAPLIESAVEQEESSPNKTDSLCQDSDSKEGPVEFSLVEVDNDGKEIKKDKPWLARAHTVEEFFSKESVGEVIPVTPTPPSHSSVPGQVNVMMEMSKATSRIGQSIMVLSGGDKRPMQRSDSDEYCISEDAIYIPLRPPEMEPDMVEESDDEPFRIDQPPPTFTYDTDEGEWGAALAEHVKKDPSLTTVIIERKLDDPSALGRVTITEITDEEEKAMSTKRAKENTVTVVEELSKPVFEIGSPVSDRSTDLNELRTDVKHRPSLADISEENLESADDNEGSMNVELHISLSDGDNLSQRSYGTDSERKWTDDLSNVAHKAKDAATGMIKNLFSSSPRKDRHSPAGSESSFVSEMSSDGGKRKRSESQEESGRQKESEVVEYKTKVQVIEPSESMDKDDSDGSSKQVVETKSLHEFEQTERGLPGDVQNKNNVMSRSLQESSESQSLTSVTVPLPDASYDIPNVTSSASTVDSLADCKDALKDDIPSDSSKPNADEVHQMEATHRLKRSVGQEEVTKDQSDEKKEAEGSGAAAGTAVQNAAEAVQDEHGSAGTRVSAKDQKETGLAGQEPASEPKDSMTSVLSETLDSVESLPSEVSKNLWSIEDVPLGENLNESGVHEEKVSENTVGEDSSKIKPGAVNEVLETIERQAMEDRVGDLMDKAAEEKGQRSDENLKQAAREAKEDMRHKLARAAEVVEDSWENDGNEGKNIESEVEQGLEDKLEAIKDALATAKDDIEGEIKDIQKGANDAKEEVEGMITKIGKDIEGKVDEGEAEVVGTVNQGKPIVSGTLDSVEETIRGAKEKITSVIQEGENYVEDLDEKSSETEDKINAKASENIAKAKDAIEEKVDEGTSGLRKLIGGVTDAIVEVKEKVSETITHVKEDVKHMVGKSEKRVEKEVSDNKETVEEQAKKVESGVEKEMDEAGDLKPEFIVTVESRVLKETDKVKDNADEAGKEVKQKQSEIGEAVEKAKQATEGSVHEGADKVNETAEKIEGDVETVSREGSNIAEAISTKKLEEVEKRLEVSMQLEEDGIDPVDGAKGTEIYQESGDVKDTKKAGQVRDSTAEATSTTRMVLDKRKGHGDKSEEDVASNVLARSIESPGTVALFDDTTDSSGKEDSSETRRSKRMLKRGVTLGDLPRSADTILSESVDETSLERADTVVHMTPDELEAKETISVEAVVVPVHAEPQEATPVPPGKDTKATETDLLEKETVSRGTEPEETSEQIAEALRSEVKDLEERLSRLRESTWSLSHAGPDSRKGEGDIHASKVHVDGDEATERTVHVKKSISSAESMSFASRVLSTPMGSVREEFSEMKKSMAETTLETVLTMEKGVQSEGDEVGGGGIGNSGPKKTVTTATQVSVPSNETSDDESRLSTFQRAKSMDAKTEARAITNFAKRNSRMTVETKKTDSSLTRQTKSAKPTTSGPQDFLAHPSAEIRSRPSPCPGNHHSNCILGLPHAARFA